jgi:osmotically-inducible protein OsmY
MKTNLVLALLGCFLLSVFALAKDPPAVTDDSISDQVRINLASDKVVGVLPFNVAVKSGVVTLTGTADSGGQRSRAEKVARKVKGVKQVVNNITLKGEAPPPGKK